MLAEHVSSQIYPQLIDNVLKNYAQIESCRDILDCGAYSMKTAESILDILDKFSPLLRSSSPLRERDVDVFFTFSDSEDDADIQPW